MAPSQRGDAWSGMGTGWAIVSTLIGGIVVCGGVGFALDWLTGTDPIFTAVGILLGAAAAIYLVYLKWGKDGEYRT
jgi:F0F1-type ATP synthase assembly protein I